MAYDFKAIEGKWRKSWDEKGAFNSEQSDKPKFYITVAYPYPSGGMHVGHAPSALDQLAEHANDVVRVQEPGALDPDGLPSELVDDRQEAKPPTVGRLVGDEVVAPDVVSVECSIVLGRATTSPAPLLGLRSHSQALSPPKDSEPISADPEALLLQDRVDLPVPEPGRLLRQLVDLTNQPGFLDTA